MMGWFYRAADRLRRLGPGTGAGQAGRGPRAPLPPPPRLHRCGPQLPAALRRRRTRPGGLAQGALVFVEVKTRSSADFGSPDRAVDRTKRAHVERAARDYARRAGAAWENTRFDIVSVVLEDPPRIEWLQDAWR